MSKSIMTYGLLFVAALLIATKGVSATTDYLKAEMSNKQAVRIASIDRY